jgi:hypothetical protein
MIAVFSENYSKHKNKIFTQSAEILNDQLLGRIGIVIIALSAGRPFKILPTHHSELLPTAYAVSRWNSCIKLFHAQFLSFFLSFFLSSLPSLVQLFIFSLFPFLSFIASF